MTVNAPRFRALAPRVLALHCSASSPTQWDPYRDLVDGAVSWMTPALQGYDPGTLWPLGAATTLAAEARRILGLLAGCSGVVDLVGHSYGGAVALQVAATWPERIRSVSVYEPVLFRLLQQDAASGSLAREVQHVAAGVAASLRAGEPEVAGERFVDYWSGPGAWTRLGPGRRQALALRMPKVAAEFGALFAADTDYTALRPNGPLVRVVAGTASPAPVQRVMELLMEQVPHADFTHVPGAGHMAPVLDPMRLAPHLFPERYLGAFALAA